jgi:hypothetical protein
VIGESVSGRLYGMRRTCCRGKSKQKPSKKQLTAEVHHFDLGSTFMKGFEIRE